MNQAQRRIPPLLFFFILIWGPFQPLAAQIVTGDGPRHPGTTGQPAPVDTAAQRGTLGRALESAGLFEGPIDPESYRVGPNDVLTVSIVAARSVEHDVQVTPDAKVIVPGIGAVDVRGRTLSEVERKVRDAVGRTYRAADVAVALRKMRQFKIYVLGAVNAQGPVVATPMTRISEAIALAGGANSLADLRSIEILRRGRSAPMQVDLVPFGAYAELESNPTVEDGDRIRVPVQDPKNVVQIRGAVHRGGEFSFRSGDSISSLIRYAMGTKAEAFLDSVEIVSVDESGAMFRREYVRLMADGTVIGDRPLSRGDRVFVRSIPAFLPTHGVVVAGEVNRPGWYAIEPGRTKLKEVIDQAGGFTREAAAPNAELIRRRFAGDVDPRVSAINLIDMSRRTPEQIDYWMQRVREKPGLMMIDFRRLLAGDDRENVLLMPEDSLFVPSQRGSINVAGRVRNAGLITYDPKSTYRDYIAQAGGYGWKADESETQVVKHRTGDAYLASKQNDYTLEPGDQIFVPEEQPGNFWQSFTTVITIVAQVATIIAVVVSISAANSNNSPN